LELTSDSIKLDKELHDSLERLAFILDVPEAANELKECKELMTSEYSQALSRLKEAEGNSIYLLDCNLIFCKELESIIDNETQAIESATPRESQARYTKLLQLIDKERNVLKKVEWHN
jgi:hypothetical protein